MIRPHFPFRFSFPLHHRAIVDTDEVGIKLEVRVIRLSSGGKHSLPRATERVHDARRCRNDARDGDVHHAVVDEAGGEGGVASHGSMDRILCQKHAVERVRCVGGYGPGVADREKGRGPSGHNEGESTRSR